MKQYLALALALMMAFAALACAAPATPAAAPAAPAEAPAAAPAAEPAAEAPAEKETLEFYHGYFHDEATWYPAVVMREIYDEFAAQHADGPVTFVPVAMENHNDTVSAMIAGGEFPDMVDFAGNAVPLGAITQNLMLDLKPYIDEQGLQAQVGINYTQNAVDGAIYSVHDQLLTLGFWYNEKVFNDAGAALPATWTSWDDFGTAMDAIRTYGADKGVYAYGSGQGSGRCFNTALAASPEGARLLEGELTAESVNSEAFATAFKTIASLDQINGSAFAGTSANDFSADFNNELSGVFFNGVWAAGGFSGNADFQPAIFPGSVSISSAGGGISAAANLSDNQKALALEFVKYMTSEAVQKRIFLEVGANPCNTALDIETLAAESADPTAMLLAKACAMANGADTIVKTVAAAWGGDVDTAINNKLVECAVAGVDIDAKLAELQSELIAIVG